MSKPLPPGPLTTPRVIYQIVRDPFALMDRCQARYGDVYTVGGPGGPFVLTSSPEAVRALFSASTETFETRGAELATPLIGPASVLLQVDGRHKAQRKLLMPPFHGARMRAYGDIMRDAALKATESWAPGVTVNVSETTQNLSLDVIIRAIFGATDPERVSAFHKRVRATLNAFTPSVVFFTALRFELGGLSPWGRYMRHYRELTALLYAEMDRRQGQEPGEDILSMLLQMRYEDGSPPPREEIRDQLITLLLAGHETTASTLGWALDHLCRDPERRQRVLDELATVGADASPDALAQLPYLDAVCKETLRMYPVVPIVTRHTRAPFEMAGVTVPTDTSIGIAVWSVHRRPEIYPEPHRWLPERFLERSYGPHEFLPFGGGVRRCIGAAFALYEMKIVLATLLTRFGMQAVGAAAPRILRSNLTMGSAQPIRVTIADRQRLTAQA